MEQEQRNDADTLCRTCLQVLSDDALDISKHDIFLTPDIVKKLVLCTSLTVEAQDGYPRHLCDGCYAKVNEFHKFQAMCVESAQRFGELLLAGAGAGAVDRHLPFEDEKPFCEFDAAKLEITMDEADVLMQGDLNILETLDAVVEHKRIGRPKSKTKMTTKPATVSKKSPALKSTKVKQSDEKSEEAAEKPKQILAKEHAANNDKQLHDNDDDDNDSQTEDFFDDGEEEGKTDQHDSDLEELPLSKLKKTIPKKRKKKKDKNTTSTAVYKCDQCPKYFMVERNLLGHKRKHEGLLPFPCPHDGCTKAYDRHNRLVRHLDNAHAISTEQKFYPCTFPGCERVYKHRESLRTHARGHNIPEGYVPPQHICEICGKAFGKPALLRDHLITHMDPSDYPFACDQPNCTRRFAKKDKLKEHLMRHAGIKNFVCPHCGMRKTTRNELRTHINYHTLERRWPCKFCDHICNSQGNLSRHIRIVHEQARDFACRYCERKFGKKETLKHHEMTHTGEKPHECAECGKRFTQPTALKTHEKTHQRHQQQPRPTKVTRRMGVALASAITPPANVVALITEAVATAGLF